MWLATVISADDSLHPSETCSAPALTLPINIERFELTRNVTSRQYRYVVDIGRRLPPDFPYIKLQFRYRCCPGHPSHAAWSPGHPWLAAASRRFDLAVEEVAALYELKDQYWCTVCNKPLFFTIGCPLHGEDGKGQN